MAEFETKVSEARDSARRLQQTRERKRQNCAAAQASLTSRISQ